MPTSPQSDPQPSGTRWRRWLVWSAVAVVVLAAWATATLWFTGQVTEGVQDSINAAPAVEDTRHRAD